MVQPPLGSVPGMFGGVRDGPSANLEDPILSHEHQGPNNHVHHPSQGNLCDVGMANMEPG